MWGRRSDSAGSLDENLGICNFPSAMWIRAIFTDRDVKIDLLCQVSHMIQQHELVWVGIQVYLVLEVRDAVLHHVVSH